MKRLLSNLACDTQPYRANKKLKNQLEDSTLRQCTPVKEQQAGTQPCCTYAAVVLVVAVVLVAAVCTARMMKDKQIQNGEKNTDFQSTALRKQKSIVKSPQHTSH